MSLPDSCIQLRGRGSSAPESTCTPSRPTGYCLPTILRFGVPEGVRAYARDAVTGDRGAPAKDIVSHPRDGGGAIVARPREQYDSRRARAPSGRGAATEAAGSYAHSTSRSKKRLRDHALLAFDVRGTATGRPERPTS